MLAVNITFYLLCYFTKAESAIPEFTFHCSYNNPAIITKSCFHEFQLPFYGCHGDSMLVPASCDYEQIDYNTKITCPCMKTLYALD